MTFRTVVLLLLACTCAPETGHAEGDKPLHAPEVPQESAILRIAYLGPQEEPIFPLIITTQGHNIDWGLLRSIKGLHIDDWEMKSLGSTPSFSITKEDMKAVMQQHWEIVGKDARPDKFGPYLSLAIAYDSRNGPQSAVFTFSRAQANDFFIGLRHMLRADSRDITLINGHANIPAMDKLQSFGCTTGLISDADPAKDVSARVSVTHGGLRFNETDHRFETTVTLTNTSSQAINGPVTLVVDISGNVNLANAYGHTCATTPVGRAFINLPMPQYFFPPGEMLETTLKFNSNDIGNEPIAFTTKVLATPGEK